MAGLEMVHIPYRGAAPAMNDLIPGRVHFLSRAAPRSITLDQAKYRSWLYGCQTGRDRARGTDNCGRRSSWYGFFVPLKTPTEIIAKLNNDTIAALADPSVQGRLVPLGYESRPDSPAQVGAFLKAEVELWGRVIKAAGIVPQD